MMNELDLAYTRLKEKEAEEKEKKKLKREQRIKAAGNGIQTSILVVLGLFFLIFVVVEIRDAENKPASLSSASKVRPEVKAPRIMRHTGTGLPIEKGADIDSRIDSDRIIDLSVNAIRLKGHRCNSLSRIQLYRYPERIEIRCNGGKDRYRIERDSAGQLRQVTRR